MERGWRSLKGLRGLSGIPELTSGAYGESDVPKMSRLECHAIGVSVYLRHQANERTPNENVDLSESSLSASMAEQLTQFPTWRSKERPGKSRF